MIEGIERGGGGSKNGQCRYTDYIRHMTQNYKTSKTKKTLHNAQEPTAMNDTESDLTKKKRE